MVPLTTSPLLYLSDYLDAPVGGGLCSWSEGANKTVEPRAGRTHRWTLGCLTVAFPGMLSLQLIISCETK